MQKIRNSMILANYKMVKLQFAGAMEQPISCRSGKSFLLHNAKQNRIVFYESKRQSCLLFTRTLMEISSTPSKDRGRV